MKVLVEYKFIINPVDGWSNIADFEKLFSDFLATRGLVSKRITTENDCEMFEIEKLQEPVMEAIVPEKSIKQIKAKLTTKRDNKGKFRKTNG